MTPAAPNSTTIETSPRLPKAALGILVNGGEYPLLESLPHLESDARLLLNERIAGLGRELLALDDSRISLVNALLQQLQNGQDIEGLKSQLQILRQRAIDTGRRYGGLVARQRERRASYAGVLAGLEAMANSGTLSPDEVVNVQPLQSLNLRGSDARFTGDRRDIDDIDDILTLAAPRPERGPVWHTELRPGEQLRFSIRGNWSPTCAIGDVFFLFLDNDEYSRWSMPIGAVEAAETGPEGFTVQFGDQNLSAQSARSATTPVESCMVHVLPPVTRPRTRYEEADASNKCVDAEWQMIRERAQTQSLTAQFEVGLRLDDTPFPWAPAGSLVAVLIDQDGPRIIRDYQVVHRDSAIIAPKPPLDGAQNPLFTSYDVYLVVNDLGTCADPGTTPSLAISVSKVVPFGEAATALGEAMGTVLRDTEAQAPGIIEQGVFPASDQTQMRSMAWTTLQTKAKMDLNQVPAIRDLFTAWVDQQVASIDRRVQIADTQRNLAEMALEAQAIQQDLGSAGDQARLLRLVPRWRLHNLDQDALKADLRGVFSSLKDDIPPLFTLRHPASLESFRTTEEFATEMDTLMDTGFDDSVPEAAERLADFGEDVSEALLSAANHNPVTVEHIILAYPTPEQCALRCTSSPFGRTRFAGLRVPSREAIMRVWESLRLTRTATLSIGPADAYEAVGEASQLSCGHHAPIIRGMLLVGDLSGTDNPLWGPLHLASVARGNVENYYPTAAGGIVYRLPPFSEGIHLPLASIITIEDLTKDAYPYIAEVGAGMSPVNDFFIELKARTDAEFDRIEALYLVMDVDTQTTAPDVYIPGVCELP